MTTTTTSSLSLSRCHRLHCCHRPLPHRHHLSHPPVLTTGGGGEDGNSLTLTLTMLYPRNKSAGGRPGLCPEGHPHRPPPPPPRRRRPSPSSQTRPSPVRTTCAGMTPLGRSPQPLPPRHPSHPHLIASHPCGGPLDVTAAFGGNRG